MTSLLRSATVRAIPRALLVASPPDLYPPTAAVVGVTSLEEVEDAVMDVDSRVTRADPFTTAPIVPEAIQMSSNSR